MKKLVYLVVLALILGLILAGCFPSKNQSPIITSTPGNLAEVGELYTYEVQATDPDGDTLTFSLDVKPSGMTINSAIGLISWTPTAEGDYDVVVKVSDGVLEITQGFTIVVSAAAEPGYTPPSPAPPTPPAPPITYTITASAGPGGFIDPSGDVTVSQGSDISFTITPDSVFYGIDDVLVDGSSVGAVSNYAFNNVTANHTIHATFKLLGHVYNQNKGTYYDTIQEAMDDANPGDTIIVAIGTYNITSTLALNKANLVLKGEAGSKPKITTSGSNYLFNISASGVTVENFEIEKTDSVNQNIIYIGADNVTIKDNLIHGQFVMGDPQVERAMEIAAPAGLNIVGNTIHSLRQPAYINAATGTISNNDVYNTKGWVIVSQSNLTFTNNTWGDGTLPNYYDVAIIKDSPEGANNYPDIVTMSEENNNAIIENQHSTYSQAILSIVHVDATASGSLNGSILDPYADISPAIPRVAPGGTVHVAAGTYPENVTIGKIGVTLQAVTRHGAVIEGTVVITADNVTVDGFSIKNFSQIPVQDWSGIYMPSGTGILVVNNLIDGTAIDPVANLTVGIHTLYGGTAEATLENNIVRNVRMGIYNQGASLLISNNTIENTSHCGIGIDTALGIGTIITGNTISNSEDIGIEVFKEKVIANFNNITGNANFGVWSSGPQVDAKANWWGDVSGPSGVGPGTGDAISVNVDYIPWSTSQH